MKVWNTPSVKAERECWVDFLKGIAIILVVMGHCDLPASLIKIVYLFHMPLFFFISGYLDNSHRENSLWSVVKKKSARLLWPYLTYGVIVILWKTLTLIGEEGNFTTLLFKRIAAFLYGNYIWENNTDYIGTLWFLVCLFCVTCISWVLHRIKADKFRLAVAGAVALLGGMLGKLLLQWGIRLPWCLDVALVAVLFYEVGKWQRTCKKNTVRKALSFSTIFLLSGFGLGACNLLWCTSKTDMLLMQFGSLPLFLAGAVLICLGITTVAGCLYGSCRFRIIEYTGRQSLTVMIVHLHIMPVVALLSSRLLPSRGQIGGWVYFPLTTALSLLVSFFVDKKLPFLNNFQHAKRVIRK